MDSFFDFLYLNFAETFDFEECSAGRTMYRLLSVSTRNSEHYYDQLVIYSYSNSVVTIGLQLGDVCSSNTVGLNPIDVHDEVLTKVNCPKATNQ